MTRWLLALALILPLSLTGCGKTDEEKAKEKVEDAKGMIGEMNRISADLDSKGLGFTYSSYSNLSDSKIIASARTRMSTMSSASLEAVKAQFAQYASLSDRVLRIIDNKDVNYYGNRGDIVHWGALASRLQTEATVAIASALSAEAKKIADEATAAADEASAGATKETNTEEEEKTAESEAQSA